ncbi:MAG: hypothetical protein ACREHV_13395 [Rhizomicrobium sp.]
MMNGLVLGLVALAWTLPGATAAPPASAPAPVRTAVAAAASLNPHPMHAMLRYDASTAASCRSLTDASSEVCLLLALRVIRLSEKPLPGGAM